MSAKPVCINGRGRAWGRAWGVERTPCGNRGRIENPPPPAFVLTNFNYLKGNPFD